MADVIQSNDVIGNNNSSMIAARDIIIGVDDYFFSPNLEPFYVPFDQQPKETNIWMAKLVKERILFLSFEEKIDDLPILLKAACVFIADFKKYSGNDMSVKQNMSGIDLNKVIESLHKASEATLFILSSVNPQDIGFNLEILKKYALNLKHYIIIATYLPIDTWKIKPHITHCAYRVEGEDLYGLENLMKIFIKKIKDSDQLKGKILVPGKVEERLIASYPSSIKDILILLATPENISIFIELLESKSDITGKDIEGYISFIRGNEKALEGWYLKLANRDQMIALGLSLFQGIFDDQFFLIFRIVVERCWHWRDETLRAVNHKDITSLANIFTLNKTKTYGKRLGSRFPNHRMLFIQIVWENYQRQLIDALPVLVEIVKDSIKVQNDNWHLYGTETRREQVRNVISEIISDIGLIDVHVIYDSLFHLIAHDSVSVQNVAAKAIARWRAYGKDELVFDTIKYLQFNSRSDNSIKSIIAMNSYNKTAYEYIQAAVALIVGHAIVHDNVSNLDDRLKSFMSSISNIESSFVRNRFKNYALKNLIELHLSEAKGIIHDISCYHPSLHYSIAKLLARAYKENHEEVASVLCRWHKECVDSTQSDNYAKNRSLRDRLFELVVHTYGEILSIPPKENVGELQPGVIVKKLGNIMDGEENEYVRQAALIAMYKSVQNDSNEIQSRLQAAINNVKDKEISMMVETLTQIYLNQRKRMKDGDTYYEENGDRFKIWINNYREPTNIEVILNSWIYNAENVKSVEVALYALKSFAKALDIKEIEYIEYLKTRPIVSYEEYDEIIEYNLTKMKEVTKNMDKGFYNYRIVPFISTLSHPSYRDGLRYILAIYGDEIDESGISILNYQWKIAGYEMEIMSECLRKGLAWRKKKYLVYIACAILLSFVTLMAKFVLL